MIMVSDLGHKLTDDELKKLERRIARLYREAADELQETIDRYFKQFKKRDEEMRALIGTVQNGKEWTEQDYKQWRLNQIGRGERYQALRDKIANRYTDANAVAIAYTNDATPGIYSLNRNYTAYTIERATGSVGFDLWDEQTVKRLMVQQPDLMPYYPKERALKRGIDLAWGKKQITASVTSSILQGKSIKGMADDLQNRITTMNRNSAIRTARTAVTGAQNAGRMDSYAEAAALGIKVEKQWVAVKDNRTRHDHGMADGQIVPFDKPFLVGGEKLMFPGDRTGSGWNIYNCRCTMVEGNDLSLEAEPTMIRVRDPATGRNVVVPEMTYKEWAKQKQAEDKTAWDTYMKKGKNLSSDEKQWREYREILGKNVPDTLDSFQNMKYNNHDKWSETKAHYRYKKRVPEATPEDFAKYQRVKATGVIGTVRVPPEPINLEALSFKDAHSARHGCTLEDAKRYVATAKCTVRRKRWDGVSINYYSFNGAAYIDAESMKIKTAFSKNDFDPITKAIMEVFG